MRLHLLAVPHTVTHRRFSHCAFTMKVLNAAKMWHGQGLEVLHYGVEDAQLPDGVERVEVLSTVEHLELLGIRSYDEDPPTQLVGDRAKNGSPVYRQFNHFTRDELKQRLEPGDVICLPFGHAHEAAYQRLPIVDSGEVRAIETGIGYPTPATINRVYESEAWRHWVLGNEQREGQGFRTARNEWVVPNYYDLDDWLPCDPTPAGLNRVVYLGRLEKIKGLEIVPELARARADLVFELCGQGDPAPFMTEPNIVYREPISGLERNEFLGNALCGIYPSRYVEPFCGAAVETMLCGTPVITSDFGAFTETVIDGETGIRCRGIDSWLEALKSVEEINRRDVREITAGRYSLEIVGPQYVRVFEELSRAVPHVMAPA